MLSRLMLLGSLVCLTGCVEQAPPAPVSEATPAQETTAPVMIPASYSAGETLTVSVPDMHCPFVCYPRVKDTLAEQQGVESVELVEQKDEAAIDDPRLIVKLNGDFDAQSAVEALGTVGFDKGVEISAN
ncbi:hypothetical protein [Rubinisphaera margarita]|uniref:hypothetical protein n=1 Tax=Rubinisphaera margarita TaxID=2909586 RepID=UPI001EE87A85|nr:hypothetical protein [Rubinisphaera margarita]MCG6155981.1 hypothetical protein [Rubinisphaera margarita]